MGRSLQIYYFFPQTTGVLIGEIPVSKTSCSPNRISSDKNAPECEEYTTYKKVIEYKAQGKSHTVTTRWSESRNSFSPKIGQKIQLFYNSENLDEVFIKDWSLWGGPIGLALFTIFVFAPLIFGISQSYYLLKLVNFFRREKNN